MAPRIPLWGMGGLKNRGGLRNGGGLRNKSGLGSLDLSLETGGEKSKGNVQKGVYRRIGGESGWRRMGWGAKH